MFTQPVPSPTAPGPGNFPVSSVPSISPPTRTSRLRGLSYLRLGLSREHSSQSTHSNPSPQHSASTGLPSSAPNNNSNPFFADNSSSQTSPARTNRLSQLVPSLTHPFGQPNPPSDGSAHTGPVPGTTAGSRSTESSANPFLSSTRAPGGISDAPGAPTPADDMTRARAATTGDPVARHEGAPMNPLPSIRFSTFYDPRATRPSLKFSPISRTLPTGKEVIRVGRYSERDNQPAVPVNAPSAAPVGFRSKVVSRRHCEFWYEDGKWYIKDVKSSSGTFLNHIRLSPPGTESKPYPVNDGDIVQLGIDFKGGEEMIFRCVKMRLELNRGWQNKLNTFNMATHKRLRNMTAGSGNNSSSQSYSQDCSICLNSIAPCQCLFVAPCSHTWHYKCIRSLLSSPSYPIFICPNCRAAADLEAEVEDPEDWEQLDADEAGPSAAQEGALLQAPSSSNNPDTSPSAPRRSRESVRSNHVPPPPQHPPPDVPDVDMLDAPPGPIQQPPPQQQQQQPSPDNPTVAALAAAAAAAAATAPTTLPGTNPFSQHSTSPPMAIPGPSSASAAHHRALSGDASSGRRAGTRTPSPTGGGPVGLGGRGGPGSRNGGGVGVGHEGPITPRNDAGPWVFDGSGVRLSLDGPDGGSGSGGGGGGDAGRENGARVGAATVGAATVRGRGFNGSGEASAMEEDDLL